MTNRFDQDEWKRINETLDREPERYGFPARRDGSVLLGSFNIRKLGDPGNRTDDEWRFLAKICAQFDLLAIQEIMSDLSGLRRLREELPKQEDHSDSFAAVVSDETGAFAGDRGLRERLGFIYRWSAVERMEIASDLTYDRTKTFETLVENAEKLKEALDACDGDLSEFDPRFFVTFARQPHGVAFRIRDARPNPYEFMAVNAHLIFGDRISERRQEFTALMELLRSRFANDVENLILMGDLNLDFDDPDRDRARVDNEIKQLGASLTDSGSHINFPFLDKHKGHDGVFRTNARRKETYDHIGLFAHDQRLPACEINGDLALAPEGPDYGVFDFMALFSEAIYGKGWDDLTEPERDGLLKKIEHRVSDHMPLWLRLPLKNPNVTATQRG